MSYSSQVHLASGQEFQHPYRNPSTLQPQDVCPHCKRKTTEYRFTTGEHPVITHHCPEHGDVIPMRSVIVRD